MSRLQLKDSDLLRQQALFGGRWQDADNGETLPVVDPATRETLATIPALGHAETEAAIACADASRIAWGKTPNASRAALLEKWHQLILDNVDDLATIMTAEQGKPLAEAKGEVLYGASFVKWFAEEARRIYGDTIPAPSEDRRILVLKQPVGVAAAITPWNFPIAIPAWKAAPALAFGNTVVIKPASHTPATAEALVAILHEAGLPKGVLNLVIGGGRVGQAIVDHKDVAGVSFTGSQGVGAGVAAGAAARQARVQLEMGGKNPLIVLDDADLDRAVNIALDGSFFATGQRCTASSRLIVQDGIHDRFVAALAEKVAALRVGNALDPDTQVGPAVSEAQRETSYRYIDIAASEGGRVVAGGGRLNRQAPGWYVEPTLIADTDPAMRINNEEVFGPVASTIRVKDYEEALAVANGVEFGLSAGIVTQSLKHARDFQRRAKAGMTMVNLATAGVDYHVPFGGTKASSYGPREQGFAAADFFTLTKTSYSAG
nr:aldehyde dehydrogenase family protein [Pantoea septica]